MSSNLKVNSIVPATGSNVAIGTAGGTISYNANVSGVSTFTSGIVVSVGSTEALRTDSNSNIGIKTTSTSGFNGACDDVVISGSSSPGLTFHSTSTTGTGSIAFTDAVGSTTQGAINYVHNGDYMMFQTGASEKMRIDSSGRVTTPYQPSFQTAGTNYTQTNAATVIIPNVVVFITGFTHSSGVFTVPVSGKYLFGFWGLSYPHGTEVNHILAYKNGAAAGQLVQFNGTATNHEECSGTVLLDMSASDTFSWVYNRGSGSAAAYNTQWNMWGYLVG